MISKKYKLIFIHIPKTGGSSVEKSMSNIFDEKINIRNGGTHIENDRIKKPIKNSFNSLKHATATELFNHYGSTKFNNYHKFTIIRNPWDRLLSLYKWNTNKKYNKKDFINFLPKNNPNEINRAKWTINKFICNNKGDVMVNTLLDFNNLNEEFKSLTEKFNLKIDLPHINKSKHNFNFNECMDDEVISMVNNLYKIEVDKFWTNYI